MCILLEGMARKCQINPCCSHIFMIMMWERYFWCSIAMNCGVLVDILYLKNVYKTRVGRYKTEIFTN